MVAKCDTKLRTIKMYNKKQVKLIIGLLQEEMANRFWITHDTAVFQSDIKTTEIYNSSVQFESIIRN